ncbi:MAG: rhodanese-like domain-containing protein [Deltaproteobacteria bacterium]|nr:rhodanese-like domain-containing protein [Deltaproteobacteria bacterium]
MYRIKKYIFLLSTQQVITPWRIVFRDAAIIIFICTLIACITNLLRSDGIPFIQKQEYQILVPCPVTTGEVDAVTAGTALIYDDHVIVIDARQINDRDKFKLDKAIHIPYDYLTPVASEIIDSIAASGAREILVFGDGSDPDSGEQLARELAGNGIKNVSYIKGGAKAMIAKKLGGATNE